MECRSHEQRWIYRNGLRNGSEILKMHQKSSGESEYGKGGVGVFWFGILGRAGGLWRGIFRTSFSMRIA